MAAEITETGTGGLRGLPGLNQRNYVLDQIMSEDLNRYNPRNNQGIGIQAAQVGYGDSQYDDAVTSVNQFDNLNDVRYNEQSWADVLANGVGKMLGTAATTFINSLAGVPAGLYTAATEHRLSGLWDNDVTQALGDVDDWLEKNMTNYKSEYQQQSPWWDTSNLFAMNQIADSLIKNAGFMIGAAAATATAAGGLGLLAGAMGFVNNVSRGASLGTKFLSSLFAATGEGMIEARQGVESRNNLLLQKLNDEFNPEYNALAQEQQQINAVYDATRGQNFVYNPETGRPEDAAYREWRERMNALVARKQELDRKKKAAEDEILVTGRQMGNRILLGNQVLLTLSNAIQFGKAISKSFDNARHAASIVDKTANPAFVSAVRAGKDIAEGWKITGKGLGRTVALLKDPVTEGMEEMNQEFISRTAGIYYNRKDVNDYWKARLEPDSIKDVADGSYAFGEAISKGWEESWGDPEQWEQFVVGAITGGVGMAMPTKLFNQDKTKSVWNPARYLSWESGAIESLNSFNDEYKKYEANINNLNNVVRNQDFVDRIQRLGAHTALQKVKEYAALEGDKKLWKDADDKQAIHDIQAFVRAGKVDDLRTLYNEIGKDLSDEALDKLIANTPLSITKEQDKENHDKEMNSLIAKKQEKLADTQAMLKETEEKISKSQDNTDVLNELEKKRKNLQESIEAGNKEIEKLIADRDSYEGQERKGGLFLTKDGNLVKEKSMIREAIQHNADELEKKLDSYLNSLDAVRQLTRGNLTNDQEDTLAYIHNVAVGKDDRVDKIMSKARKILPKKFLLKTDKTPEQLQKQTSSSDLAFSVNENTPEGYVEVDTSAINDAAFGIFFIDNVLLGGNLQAHLTEEEQEEERKAREEDKNYTEEERKKRVEERIKKAEEKLRKRNDNTAKDRVEQWRKNVEIINKAFEDNAMKDGQSLNQVLKSKKLEELYGDLADALALRREASIYWDTFEEYINDPSKADTDKKEAVKEAEKKEEEKSAEVDEKATVASMSQMSNAQLRNLFYGSSKKGNKKAAAKAKKAIGIKNIADVAEKSASGMAKAGNVEPGTLSDAQKLLAEQHRQMLLEGDDKIPESLDAMAAKMFDTETSVMTEGYELLTPEERKAFFEGSETPEEAAALAARLDKAKDLIRKIGASVQKEMAQMEDNLITGKMFFGADEQEDGAQRDVNVDILRRAYDDSKIQKAPGSPKNDNLADTTLPGSIPADNKKAGKIDTLVRITSEGDSEELDNDAEKGKDGKNIPLSEKPSGWHPWLTSTSEVGQRSNDPYVPSASDPLAGYKKKRYDVIRQKLVDAGAYTAIKEGKVKEMVDGKPMEVGFKVFQDVNDATKMSSDDPGDFVIFITDKDGNIIGDLPSNDPRLSTSARTVPMDDLYAAIKEEWEAASPQVRKDGMQSKYTSVIDHVFVGKVRYQKDRQTVAKLMQGSGMSPLFAIRVREGQTGTTASNTGDIILNTQGVADVLPPLTGNIGQPYVLIRTPKVNSKEGKFSYYTVPIHTKKVADLPRTSTFRIVLWEVLDRLKYGKISDSEAAYLLEDLLAVGNVHVNMEATSNTKKKPGIRVTTFNRISNVEKGKPYTIYEGNKEDMDVNKVIENLIAEIPEVRVNIALSRINGGNNRASDSQLLIEGKPVDYNAMIAEVAETNAAEPMTVNDWFTIRPVIKGLNGKLTISEEKDNVPEWKSRVQKEYRFTPHLKSKSDVEWSVVPEEGYKVYDENHVEIKKGDSKHSSAEKAEANRLAAEAYGIYNLRSLNIPYACVIDGVTKVYDPVKRSFKTPEEWESDPKYRRSLTNTGKPGRTISAGERSSRISRAFIEVLNSNDTGYPYDQIEVTKSQIGKATAEYLQTVADVVLVDDAAKAVENLEDAQLLAIGEQGARNLDSRENALWNIEANERMNNLSAAVAMENAGKDANTIKLATGWERGADSKWRYEIPDFTLNSGLLHILINRGEPVTLLDLIRGDYKLRDKNAKDLFTAYPRLKDTKIIFAKSIKEGLMGTYLHNRNAIILYPESLGIEEKKWIDDKSRQSLEKTLIHEIQHAIQHIERFQTGMPSEVSKEYAQDYKDDKISKWDSLNNRLEKIKQKYIQTDPLAKEYDRKRYASAFGFENVDDTELKNLRKHFEELIDNDAEAQDILRQMKKLQDKIDSIDANFDSYAYEFYYRSAGEAEARAAGTRHFMTAEERRNTLLTDSIYKDVSKEDLIFLANTSNRSDSAIQPVSADLKDPLISYINEANEDRIIKGELGVNKSQLISLLGSTMYKANVQTTAVKELVQNAFDAVKIAKSQGDSRKPNIYIKLDSNNRTVTVKDNGTGMTPEIVQKAFFTIGGSYKGDDVDNRLKSGGLGLAKMAFLFSSDYVEVSTVRNGIKTYTKATPDEIQSDNFSLKTSRTDEENGTTVTVKIPEYYYDENGEKRSIYFDSRPSFLNEPMIGDVTVTLETSNYWGHTEKRVEDKNVIPEGYTSIGTATSDFGDLEIYVAPYNGGSIRSKILISGLYQFTDFVYTNGNSRFQAIVNILPSVGVKSPNYPINNQREGFRGTVDPEVKDLKYLLLKINSTLEKKSITAAFNRSVSMNVKQVAEVKREDATANILQETVEQVMKEFTSSTDSSATSKKMNNTLDLKRVHEKKVKEENKEKERRSSFDSRNIDLNETTMSEVDTSGLDLKKPLFHNNTTMVIEEDGQKVLEELGSLLMELKELYIQTYEGEEIPTRYGNNITDFIKRQYWGFSFDKNYGGVNVNPKVLSLLAVNPFYQIPKMKNVDAALALTGYIEHLIIHEFNHNYAARENAEFTGRFPMTYAEFAGIGPQYTKNWKNKLYLLISNNLNTFIKYEQRYKDAANLGESFEGESITRGEESQNSSSQGNGRDSQGQGSEEDVPGYGSELREVFERIKELQVQEVEEGSPLLDYYSQKKDFAFLKTVSGKVLGFEYKGKIYLQKNAIDPNLPMHEYTHLWDRVIKAVDLRLWNRGKEILKKDAADLWKEISESENYGKRWKKEGKSAEMLEDLIASEVHARLVGDRYDKYVDEHLKEHPESTFAALGKWLLDVFKKIAKTLGMSDAEVKNLTLDDFKNMVIRDFLLKDITMETKRQIEEMPEKLRQMREESEHYILVKWNDDTKEYVPDPEGDYYQDNRDKSLHVRVSSAISADEDVVRADAAAGFGGDNPAFIPSTGAGGSVDRFVRTYYKDGDPLDGFNLNDKKENKAARDRAYELISKISNPNINDEDAVNTMLDLHRIKQTMGPDWEIDSSGIKAVGTVSFDGKTFVNVAGTIDLLMYNRKKGQYVLVDMKSHISDLFDASGNLKTDPKTKAKLAHWAAQQTMYAKFLEAKYGIRISGIRIMPFSVSYNTKFSETNYKIENGVLTDNGIPVDIGIKYDGKMISLQIKENVKYSVASLPESVKRLMNAPIVTTPSDSEIPLKAQLAGLLAKVPSDMKLSSFISSEYAGNKDVEDVINTLEASRSSDTPVLMTAATQTLALNAIDSAALDAEVLKRDALKEKILLNTKTASNTPVEPEEKALINPSSFSTEVRDVYENISGRAQSIVISSIDSYEYFKSLVDAENEVDEIERAILRYAPRKRKATSLPYRKLDIHREMRWLSKNLPQISRERRLLIMKGLIACSDGTLDFGRIERGLILIGTDAAEGTLYHEAFHYVTQFLLTDSELDRLFQAGREKYGNIPEVAIEEKLANDFSDYIIGLEAENGSIRRLFRKLWDAIKAILGNRSYIQTLYRDINTGIYAGREFKDDRNNAFSNLTDKDREMSRNYEYLTADEQKRLENADIDRDMYNALTKDQKEYLLHCVV